VTNQILYHHRARVLRRGPPGLIGSCTGAPSTRVRSARRGS